MNFAYREKDREHQDWEDRIERAARDGERRGGGARPRREGPRAMSVSVEPLSWDSVVENPLARARYAELAARDAERPLVERAAARAREIAPLAFERAEIAT